MDVSNAEDDFLLQAQRKAKREFLAEDIVSQGYSTQLFTKFCEERRGSDIDSWDFEALHECVRDFKVLHQPGEEVLEDLQISKESEPVRLAGDEYWVKGAALSATALSEEDVKVALHSVEVVPASLLGRARLVFAVDTSPLGWSVRRGAEDCMWLRSTLLTQFPGEVVPPLADKKETKSESRWMQKRLQQLQYFCEEVVLSPLFRRSAFVVSFLSESQSRFQDSKKASAKLRRPIEAEQMPCVSGTVRCCTGCKSLFVDMAKVLTQAEAVERQFKRQSAAVASALKIGAREVEKLAQGLQGLTEALGQQPFVAACAGQLQALSVGLGAWSKHQLQLSSLVQGTLQLFFAHKSREAGTMRELLREREGLQAAFSATEAKLNERKERLWQQGDVSKWEVAEGVEVRQLQRNKDLAFPCMLSRDSLLLQRQKDLLGYFNAQARRLRLASPLDTRRLSGFAEDFGVCLAALELEWRTFSSKLESFSCA
jgi:hypothetical protein